MAYLSNYWNYKCLTTGNRTGKVDRGLSDSIFLIKSGFYSIGKLNFYKNSNKFFMYKDGGDGSVISTYELNNRDTGKQYSITGSSLIITGGYICYTYICN